MLSKESRKDVIRKFKEREPAIGIYAVRCTQTGHAWVGASKNLEATQNRCWFSLRSGSHQDKLLQQEWDAHGESAFKYEILGQLDKDVHSIEMEDLLKGMRRDWIARLNAQRLL